MSVFEILGLVWTASMTVILVDALVFLGRAEKNKQKVLSRQFSRMYLTTIPVAPVAAAVVLFSWLFSVLDAFGMWVEKLRKENDDEDL